LSVEDSKSNHVGAQCAFILRVNPFILHRPPPPLAVSSQVRLLRRGARIFREALFRTALFRAARSWAARRRCTTTPAFTTRFSDLCSRRCNKCVLYICIPVSISIHTHTHTHTHIEIHRYIDRVHPRHRSTATPASTTRCSALCWKRCSV